MPNRIPTDAELEILSVLWERGPSTVREVHGELEQHRAVVYTTVQGTGREVRLQELDGTGAIDGPEVLITSGTERATGASIAACRTRFASAAVETITPAAPLSVSTCR